MFTPDKLGASGFTEDDYVDNISHTYIVASTQTATGLFQRVKLSASRPPPLQPH